MDEATVCEAIASKESDLWVRFGHIVPLYVFGALYVVKADAAMVPKIERFIAESYHNGMFRPLVKGCRGETALIHLRRMPIAETDSYGKPIGPLHFSQQLQKALGVPTLERFSFNNDPERLAQYCREDAELCERLVNIDYGNEGKGLCSAAGPMIGVSSLDDNYQDFLRRCGKAPPEVLACAEYARDRRDQEDCRSRILQVLDW